MFGHFFTYRPPPPSPPPSPPSLQPDKIEPGKRRGTPPIDNEQLNHLASISNVKEFIEFINKYFYLTKALTVNKGSIDFANEFAESATIREKWKGKIIETNEYDIFFLHLFSFQTPIIYRPFYK